MLVRTMPLLAALMMVSACGSASGSTPREVDTAHCYAMSLVFSDLANFAKAPPPQREALAKVRSHFATKFQNAVADVVTRGGDVNGLSEQTMAFLEEVKKDPLKRKDDFRKCTDSALADLGVG
jgi:hypothetical protein